MSARDKTVSERAASMMSGTVFSLSHLLPITMWTECAKRTGVMCMMKTAGRQTRPMRGSSTAKPTSSPCRTCRTRNRKPFSGTVTQQISPLYVTPTPHARGWVLIPHTSFDEEGLLNRSFCIKKIQAYHEQCLEGVGVLVTDGELDAQPVAWHPHGSAGHESTVVPYETDRVLVAVGPGLMEPVPN